MKAFKNQQNATKRAIKGEKMKFEGKLANSIKEDTKSFFTYMKSKIEASVVIGLLEKKRRSKGKQRNGKQTE